MDKKKWREVLTYCAVDNRLSRMDKKIKNKGSSTQVEKEEEKKNIRNFINLFQCIE